MNNLAVFNFNNNQVRVITKNNEPWFVVKDLCKVLGISKQRDAISRLDEDERGSVKLDTSGEHSI
jgi:prophage antirepressor-like protein